MEEKRASYYTIQKVRPKEFAYPHAVALSEVHFAAMKDQPVFQYITQYHREKSGKDDHNRIVRHWARQLKIMSWNKAVLIVVAHDPNHRPLGYACWVLPDYMVRNIEQPLKYRLRALFDQSWCIWNDLLNRRFGWKENPAFNGRGLAYAKEHQHAHHSQELTLEQLEQLSEEYGEPALVKAQYPVGSMVQLNCVVTTPQFQRCGIGQNLVEQSLKRYIADQPLWLRNKNAAPQKVFLWSSQVGKRLYSKLGFRLRSEYVDQHGNRSTCMEYARQ